MKNLLIIIILLIILIGFLYLPKCNEKFNNLAPQYEKYDIEMSPKLSKNDIEDLKKGHNLMTNMLKEFDQICRNHNLKYWCIGGTLIGVIRHQGWIPWDGDIDVGMFKNDYNKLQKIIQKELPKGLWFQDHTTDKHYTSDIGKIRDLNSNYKDYKSQSWHNGLQLDIFIFNNENNEIKRNNKVMPYKIFPLKERYFENIKVYLPSDYKKYLIHYYSEKYMDFPPVKSRFPHEGRFDFNTPKWMIEKYPDLYKY
jgi:phosphorylcholine metabolism protein LicD